MMKIKSDRIELKRLSIEWVNYHFLAIVFLLFGIIQLYSYFAHCLHGTPDKEWLSALSCFAVSYCLYLFKLNKLKHKQLRITCNDDIYKAKIIALLKANGWEIRYNNQRYLQAIRWPHSTALLFLMIWKRDRTLWNCIHDPFYRDATIGLISDSIGRKIARKIEVLDYKDSMDDKEESP